MLYPRRKVEARIELFRHDFALRIPESFPTLEFYLRCRYGLADRPVFRSPADRHPLFVTSDHGSGHSRIWERVSAAIKRGEKNELIAALTAPFDHVPDWDDASRQIQTLLREIECLDDDEFARFLKQVAPTLNRILWEKLVWWSSTTLPDLVVRYLTLGIAILFFTQTILGISVIQGSSADWLPSPLGHASSYQLSLVLATALLLALAVKRQGVRGGVRRALIVAGLALLLPLYIAGVAIIKFLRTVGSVLSDILEFGGPSDRPYDPPWPFRSNLAMAVAIVGLGLCCVAIALAKESQYVAPATIALLILLWVLLIWLYYWNFRPLQLLELGVRLYVFFYTFGIDKDPSRIRRALEQGKSGPRSSPDFSRLSVAIEHCKSLRRRSSSWRLLFHTANTFVAILAVTFALLVVGYGVALWGVAKAWSGVIVSSAGSRNLDSFADSLRISLNNLPIGGSAVATATGLPGDLLLFSERVGAVLVLVLTIFGYSTVAASEVLRGGVRFRRNVRGLQQDLEAALAAYRELGAPQLAPIPPDGAGTDSGTRLPEESGAGSEDLSR